MWECNYGKEPLDIRLFMLRLFRKAPVIVLAAFLGALCIGGPYFLRKVTFGPAKEYEAVTDFYIDYAVQENGEEYTYFNQTTWTQLITDDVFTDKILSYMSGIGTSEGGKAMQEVSLPGMEEAAGITKQQLREYLYATMLSDTRIVTTTITTNDPEMTMKIEEALILAMEDFGKEQKEIREVRILQEPEEASLVIADVRTFRACMLGAVIFVFVTVLYLSVYFVLDEGIHIPATFERRFGVPMLGTICSGELPVLAKKLFSEERQYRRPLLAAVDEKADVERVREALAERGIEAEADDKLNEILERLYRKAPGGAKGGEFEKKAGIKKKREMDEESEGAPEISAGKCLKELQGKRLLLIVKAGAHNGKRTEKLLDFCRKCDLEVGAALLWEADEKLIGIYEAPEHVLHAWSGRKRNRRG